MVSPTFVRPTTSRASESCIKTSIVRVQYDQYQRATTVFAIRMGVWDHHSRRRVQRTYCLALRCGDGGWESLWALCWSLALGASSLSQRCTAHLRRIMFERGIHLRCSASHGVCAREQHSTRLTARLRRRSDRGHWGNRLKRCDAESRAKWDEGRMVVRGDAAA